MMNKSNRILLTTERAIDDPRRAVIALGLFDGVHIAHAELIRRAKAAADSRGGVLLIHTLNRHPMEIFSPERAPLALMPLAAKVRRLFDLGASVVLTRSFDPSFARIPPDEFIRSLAERYHPSDLFVGYNYSFGRDGSGTPDLLSKRSGEFGYSLHVLKAEKYEYAAVSSTRVRQALSIGDLLMANRLLGRPYELYGRINERRELILPGRFAVPHPGKYLVSMDGQHITAIVTPDRSIEIGSKDILPTSRLNRIQFISKL
ncbi:MAG: hypothetical protein LBS72_06365 [Oscillospiraceae bacterium]|jgi:riboflavin kinase/FMN adenylyltransferase|nr:hypothetical protein [Oscillospiraceae bacterium]